MATPRNDTWLVVPLYNEEKMISEVITEALPIFPNIVCIDDGSKDDSASVALAAGAVLITHPINLGQGAALQTGFDFIKGFTDAKYVVTFDADGQHSVADALNMVTEAQEKDLAIIFGSRFLSGPVEAGYFKRCVLKVATLVTRWKTGLRLTDAHNGLRLLRHDAVETIQLKQNRMAHASEIVSQLAKSKLPWAEMPVHIRYTDYSRAKGQSLLNSVNILVDLLVN